MVMVYRGPMLIGCVLRTAGSLLHFKQRWLITILCGQDESDIKSTGARNDYILSLVTANAHQVGDWVEDLFWDNIVFLSPYKV